MIQGRKTLTGLHLRYSPLSLAGDSSGRQQAKKNTKRHSLSPQNPRFAPKQPK